MFYYAHQLLEDDYGRYQGFWAQLNIFNAVAGLGIAIFSLTYSTDKIRLLLSKIKPKYYMAYFFFLLTIGMLFGWLQQGNDLSLYWSLLFLAAFALCNISDALLIVYRKFKFLVSINFLYAVGFFGIHYLFIETPFRFDDLLASLLPLLFLKLIVSAWIIFRHNLKNRPEVNDEEVNLKGMYALWGHIYLYDILQIASLWLDKFIISLFMDSRDTGIYINGSYNIPFLPIFFSAIVSGALIHLSERKGVGDKLLTVHNIGRILSSVAFPVTILFVLFRTEFIVFFFSDKYLESVPIFLYSVLILPFRAYGHTVLLQNLEKGKIINQGAVLDIIVAVGTMYPLYLLMGLPGVALSFSVSTLIQSLFYGYHTGKILKVPLWSLYPLKNWLVKAVFFMIIGILVYYRMPQTWNANLRLFLGAGIIASISLLVLWYEVKKNDKDLMLFKRKKRLN